MNFAQVFNFILYKCDDWIKSFEQKVVSGKIKMNKKNVIPSST